MSNSAESLNSIFSLLADELAISKTMSEKAVSSYSDVGRWIESGNLPMPIEVYPQGSFGLGTVKKPLNGNDDEYDIDLVCYLPEMKLCSAQLVKWAVGDRLCEHEGYKSRMEEEGKRCWTMQYSGFHMDILPCTAPTQEGYGIYSDTEIAITNRDEQGYYTFKISNPKGFRKWFIGQMGHIYDDERKRIAERAFCKIEEVELFQTKTVLQKAIILLKHHRDVMFEGCEHAPISIIITTLAARAYRKEENVYDALIGIISRMRSYIFMRNGIYFIENPVAPEENFADKWEVEPEKARAFFSWLEHAEKDFGPNITSALGLNGLKSALEKCMGSIYPERALKAYGKDLDFTRKAGVLFAGASGLSKVASKNTTAVKEHSFYGNE